MIIIQLSQQEQSYCHCCGKQLAGAESAIDTTLYYGQTGPNEAYKAKVLLPICSECQSRQKKRSILIWTIMGILALPTVISAIKHMESLFDLWPLVFIGILGVGAAVSIMALMEGANGYKSVANYPVHVILSKYKWEMGEFKPDEKSQGHPEIDETIHQLIDELKSEGYLVEDSPYDED